MEGKQTGDNLLVANCLHQPSETKILDMLGKESRIIFAQAIEQNQTNNWGFSSAEWNFENQTRNQESQISKIQSVYPAPQITRRNQKNPLCWATGSRQISCIAALWPIPVTLVESLVKTFTTSLCRIDLFSLSALKRAWNLLKNVARGDTDYDN